jgi:hypothetical protein
MMPRSVVAHACAWLAFAGAVGCGSDGSANQDSVGGAGAGGAATGGASSSGGSPGAGAEVRFRYQAEWKDHLGVCAYISDYRIKFGAIPVPITVPIDVTPDSLGEYVGIEGHTYADSDVLHIFSCNRSQTSKDTKQLYGRFGTDLGFEPSKRYTVTLGGDVATLSEDP